MAKAEHAMLEIAGHEVRLSNPAKVYFPKLGWTKLDLVEYYLASPRRFWSTCASAPP